jgi:Lrp/AsnC family leucine-responsive transcriptional regulator
VRTVALDASLALSYDQAVPAHEVIDDIDRKILAHLTKNARQPAAAIAAHVDLTPSAVRRRVARLERLGVIAGYTVVLDHDRVGPSVEAYVELTFTGDTNVHALLIDALKRSEVREASTIAGDPDAIVRVRVDDLDQLRKVVTDLRQSGSVTGSKTLVVLGRLRHASVHPPKAESG